MHVVSCDTVLRKLAIIAHAANCELVYRASIMYEAVQKAIWCNHENYNAALMTSRAETILLMITSPRHICEHMYICEPFMRMMSARIYDLHAVCTPYRADIADVDFSANAVSCEYVRDEKSSHNLRADDVQTYYSFCRYSILLRTLSILRPPANLQNSI